jgi:hypothetical protein
MHNEGADDGDYAEGVEERTAQAAGIRVHGNNEEGYQEPDLDVWGRPESTDRGYESRS